jgi:hypothetical protein
VGKEVARSFTPVSSDDDLGHVDFVIKVLMRILMMVLMMVMREGEERSTTPAPFLFAAPGGSGCFAFMLPPGGGYDMMTYMAWSSPLSPTLALARCTLRTCTPSSPRAARCRSTSRDSRCDCSSCQGGSDGNLREGVQTVRSERGQSAGAIDIAPTGLKQRRRQLS